MWRDSKDGRLPVETVLVRELVPRIDASFRTIARREGRLAEEFSMGGYGAARLGFKHPDLFAHASILAGGPLQRDFTAAPRVSERGRLRGLDKIFGGGMEFFREQSPWQLAEENATRLRRDSTFRVVIGQRDEMLGVVREFHDHLSRLEIPHEYRELPGVPHDPNAMLQALGGDNWSFYNEVFRVGTNDVSEQESIRLARNAGLPSRSNHETPHPRRLSARLVCPGQSRAHLDDAPVSRRQQNCHLLGNHQPWRFRG